MSKVVSMIHATSTGRHVLKREPLSKVMTIRENVSHDFAFHQYNTVYRIDVKFGAQATILAQDTDRLPYAIEDAKRNVIEYMFGEFRPYFHEINMALWEEDVPAAMEIMARFEKQMFEVDSFK